MSTLNVSNITDGTTTVGTSYVVNGSAKAWANVNGTGTPAFRDSLNFSTIVDNGTGDFTNNFTSNMANGSYSLTTAGTSSYALWTVAVNTSNTLAGSIRIRAYTSAVTLTDSELMFSAIQGDLA